MGPDGWCIMEEDCPVEEEPVDCVCIKEPCDCGNNNEQEKCRDPNSTFQDCGSDPKCEYNCKHARKGIEYNDYDLMSCMPDKKCYGRGVCNEGYLMSETGFCVPSKYCEPEEEIPVEDECTMTDENSHWQDCGSMCIMTCEMIKEGVVLDCMTGCNPGCHCKPGYVMDRNKCVPERECQKDSTIDEEAMNEQCMKKDRFSEYRSCGSYCERNCDMIIAGVWPACQEGCKEGCFCIQGYVMGLNGECIPEEECKEEIIIDPIEGECTPMLLGTGAEPLVLRLVLARMSFAPLTAFLAASVTTDSSSDPTECASKRGSAPTLTSTWKNSAGTKIRPQSGSLAALLAK